jgi:hypothetical protein
VRGQQNRGNRKIFVMIDSHASGRKEPVLQGITLQSSPIATGTRG